MLSLGMFCDFARWTASRSLKFIAGSAPPCLAARMISRESLVKMAPRLASFAPFCRLIVDHFECPDIAETVPFPVSEIFECSWAGGCAPRGKERQGGHQSVARGEDTLADGRRLTSRRV